MFLTIAAAVGVALGSCPNQCSGHGRCGEDDKCICYSSGAGTANPTRSGYFGVDCSLRTCPSGTAYDAISTTSGSLSPITFKPSGAGSVDFLRAHFVSTERASTGVPMNQRVEVKIMTADDSANGYGSFTYKFDHEEYYRPEQKIAAFDEQNLAFQLTTPEGDNTGIFVWFDETKNNPGDTWNNCVDKSEPADSCIAPGDAYFFTLDVNNDLSFDAGNANSAHQQVECSGRGACDNGSGKCKCFDGYTGDACQRTVCANACSGHGACQAEGRFVTDLKAHSELKGAYSSAYDANQQYGCKCDLGYRGPDCSMIECPSGEDPMGGEGGVEGRDCSGRGICDYSTGVCKCFKGFYGERCDAQTNFV